MSKEYERIACFNIEIGKLHDPETSKAWRKLCEFLDKNPIPHVVLDVTSDPRINPREMKKIIKRK